jgi:hypothetical protein
MSDKSNQINKIKELIGSDSNIAEEIIKYCQKIKNKSKSLIMKSYVLEKIDKTYDINIIDQYLDKITELKHKVRDNTKDCYHDIKIHTSLKINEVLVDFKCEMNEDHEDNFIIEIDGKTIIVDEAWGNDYCMIKQDIDISKFNLKHYHKLDELSQTCAQYGFVNEEKEDKKNPKDYNETLFDGKDYIDYDENIEDEKGVIDLKLFVEVCKNNFPDINPIEMFDIIMLCLIYCYRL